VTKLAYNRAENNLVLKTLVDMGEPMTAQQVADLTGLQLFRARERLNSLLRGNRVIRESAALKPGQPGWQYIWSAAVTHADESYDDENPTPAPQPQPAPRIDKTEALILLTAGILATANGTPMDTAVQAVRTTMDAMAQAERVLQALQP
jgi:hypothetical protein